MFEIFQRALFERCNPSCFVTVRIKMNDGHCERPMMMCNTRVLRAIIPFKVPVI